MKRRFCSFVLAMAFALLPVTARAAETTVSLTEGQHYWLTNTTSASASVRTGNNDRSDYAVFKSSGEVDVYYQNSSSSISIPAGGSCDITARGAVTLTLPEGVTGSTGSAPALVVYTLQAGKNYRMANSDPDHEYSAKSNAASSSSRTFETVEYEADGEVRATYVNSSKVFFVARGAYSVISIGSEAIETYLPYRLKDTVTFTEVSEPAVARFMLKANTNYQLRNSDMNQEYTITNDANNTNARQFDTVEYDADGGVRATYRNSTKRFFVAKGGYSIISVGGQAISGYMPYPYKDALTFMEIPEPAVISFTLQANSSYTLTNSDTSKDYYVSNSATSSMTFDTVEYGEGGNVRATITGTSKQFFVARGGRTTIQVGGSDLETYMPYSLYMDTLTFLDASGKALPKPGYSGGSQSALEYIYDVTDPGASLILPVEQLERVTSTASATSAVRTLTGQMTSAQKTSAAGVDLATLYAETATAKAARKAVSGNEVIINAAAVADLEKIAKETSGAVESALVSGGVSTARYLSNTVTLTTNATGEISIKIDPDILTTEVDKIRVETPAYALTLKVDELEADLTEVITITMEDVGAGYAAGKSSGKTVVSVNLPNGRTSNPVTLSLPTDKSDTTYQAVVTTSGKSTSSKYNPATVTMDGKITASGSYTVQTNEKNFSDIAAKSAEMQAAIRYLASKGIINGKTSTTFDPDGSINRAEIAALLVRALGKLDNGAANNFTDVKSGDWYYAAAGSSQRCGLIKGYNDKTFRGLNTISKVEIVAVASRVLTTEMGYTATANTADYLGKYSDTVVSWAQKEVALATRENLIVYRTDGTFSGTKNMTRGDAAIIIYRLFQRIW